MSTDVQDVLKVSVVFADTALLDGDQALASFSGSVESEVLPDGIVIGAVSSARADRGRVLRLPRDRILVTSSSLRSSVERQYPMFEDLERLAQVTACAVGASGLTGQPVSAYGVNVDLVYDQTSGESAQTYLAQRLLSSAMTISNAWSLVGGSAKLVFNDDGRRWTATLEPRLGDEVTTKVYLGLNLHCTDQQIPTMDELSTLLTDVWEQAHGLVDRVDAGVNA